ncbi:hypothetical protein EDEG_02853 [Edhazardia aedis USNM 41457]|uniref:Uncharacterized protein n=1 Tax=Edhazardia aedis (strain USNM 41457) TaxID=1003232 RepID=J9DJG9_EDHAE|nr:hypothetical protein EDEG_02853 [Edhazardia aedis USNM 41457]|eukprot:EJW02760.1 hypothetical protein EDEG_02853 [Edhazardia aedis USNM 41457]
MVSNQPLSSIEKSQKRKQYFPKKIKCCSISHRRSKSLVYKFDYDLDIEKLLNQQDILLTLKSYKKNGVKKDFNRSEFYTANDQNNIENMLNYKELLSDNSCQIRGKNMKEVNVLPFQALLLLEKYDIVPCFCDLNSELHYDDQVGKKFKHM